MSWTKAEGALVGFGWWMFLLLIPTWHKKRTQTSGGRDVWGRCEANEEHLFEASRWLIKRSAGRALRGGVLCEDPPPKRSWTDWQGRIPTVVILGSQGLAERASLGCQHLYPGQYKPCLSQVKFCGDASELWGLLVKITEDPTEPPKDW